MKEKNLKEFEETYGVSFFRPPEKDKSGKQDKNGNPLIYWQQDGEFIKSSWKNLIDILNEASTQYMHGKYDAELISPICFRNNYRAKANALFCAGWLFLDVDTNGDINRDIDRLNVLGVEAYIYATASHSPEMHKYRIVVPVAEFFSADLYFKAAHGLNHSMGLIADTSKLGSDSWCFIPAIYNSYTFKPIHIRGNIRPVGEWIDCCPETTVELLPAAPVDWSKFETQKSKPDNKEPQYSTLIEYMALERLNEYQGISGGNGKTAGLYKLLISTCVFAIRDGYQPSNNEVAQTALGIDNRTGCYHQTNRPTTIEKYASNSAPSIIGIAQQHALEIANRVSSENAQLRNKLKVLKNKNKIRNQNGLRNINRKKG